jgi:16S rRNA (guanine527-N7)-methyltransferase
LKLSVTTLHDRIEKLGQDRKYRGKFDVVTARALAPWPVLLEYTLPFVKVGGWFVAYQGPAIMDDLETFAGLEKKLGGSVDRVTKFELGEMERYLVWVQKKSLTPKRFPREVGVPKKEPLK